jgi:zinc transport system substrate-binding protein
MKKFIKSLIIIIPALLIVGLFLFAQKSEGDKLTIVSTSFPGYDFARAITKNTDDAEVKMLISPGAEMHDFEPTPQDIKDIQNSDLFIYVGGDSDEWVEGVLSNINPEKTKIVKLMNLVDTVEEEHIEGMEEHHDDEEEEFEPDEHVWTSPANAIAIINKLKDEVVKIDSNNKSTYEKNAANYIAELEKIDQDIKAIVASAKRKELIFGDRFPLRYFADAYGLSYYAAFPGCSEQTEASAKTISFLIDKVKEDNVPVVFKIELSNGKIAEAIASETGTKVLEFHTAHNISRQDFDDGITYADLMKRNIEVLREALE